MRERDKESKMNQVDIITAIKDRDLFRPLFRDLKTWSAWMTFFKALDGLKMTDTDNQLYQKCTNRKTIPKKGRGFNEAYAIVGARGGKSYASALIATHNALFKNWQKHLARGERAYVFNIATDRVQAKQVLSYIRGILELFPDQVEKDLTWEIELKNNITIAVKTCNYRAGRGFSTCCVILDELAFYRDENSANPAEQILASLLPRLLPNGKLIGISTPYGKFGYLYQIYKDYFGEEQDDVLVWKAPTKVMNPMFQDSLIKRFFRRDKIAARSEYGAEFREDVSQFLTEDDVDAAMEDYKFRYPEKPIVYSAFCDPSGGRQDSFTLSIGHPEDGIVHIDRLEEIQPPLDPDMVVKDFCEILKRYRIWKIVGDRYGGEWVSGAFKKCGIKYITSSLDKSQIYLESQPLFSMKKIKLPKLDKLKTQLLMLERKPRIGGRDLVDHPAGLHDDLANSVCGVAVDIHQNISQKPNQEELCSRRPVLSSRRESPFLIRMREKRSEEEQLRRDILREIKEEERI